MPVLILHHHLGGIRWLWGRLLLFPCEKQPAAAKNTRAPAITFLLKLLIVCSLLMRITSGAWEERTETRQSEWEQDQCHERLVCASGT